MNDAGPWLFATVLVAASAYVFVNVPNVRKWFGYSILGIVGAVVLTLAFVFLPQLWMSKYEFWKRASLVNSDKTSSSDGRGNDYTSEADIQVKGPDGHIFVFPAGTSDEVIASVMAKRYPPTWKPHDGP